MKTQIPYDAAEMQKFLDWLEAHGAEMIELTNEYEVARYSYEGRVHVIYKTKRKNYDRGHEHLSFSDDRSYIHYNNRR